MKCAECDRTVKDHQWGRIQAQKDGWFFSRDDTAAYCPDHVPAWVEAWRKGKS